MFNKGMFYKDGLSLPKYRYDIKASENGYDAEDGDATNLPINDNSIQCMILDPPFMFGKHGKTDQYDMTLRYSMYDSFEDLEQCYKGILSEAFRVLRKRGILIFKCQDYTDSKTVMTHCLVYNWAKETGFYPKDIAIFESPVSKIYNSTLRQRHLRKRHCYFWVFEKK